MTIHRQPMPEVLKVYLGTIQKERMTTYTLIAPVALDLLSAPSQAYTLKEFFVLWHADSWLQRSHEKLAGNACISKTQQKAVLRLHDYRPHE